MLVSHEREFIFMHVPKTAGCSVAEVLMRCIGGKNYHENWPGRHRPTPHVLASKMSRKYAWFNRYWRCAFVRHPFDRLISIYHFWKKQEVPTFDHLTRRFNNLRPLEATMSPGMLAAPHYSGFEEWFHAELYNITNQVAYICTPAGKIVPEFLGRYEHLQRDFDFLMTHLGLPTVELPHRNHSPHKPYQEFFRDPQIRSMAADHFWPDLSTFGYKVPPRQGT